MNKLKILSVVLASAGVLAFAGSQAADAVSLTYSAAAPVPDGDDVANLVGGSRDGLNLDEGNGLDGPLNDVNTYIAFDRQNQGQTFTTGPAASGYFIDAVWLQHVGYTDNGQVANQEGGYNGTFYMVPAGASFQVRVTDPSQAGNAAFVLDDENTQALTGAEANALPVALSSSDNGTGTWLRFGFDSPTVLAASTVYGFDVMSVFTTGFGADPFFETLGDSDNYAGGTAYGGGTLANSGGPDNQLIVADDGDRVFVVELREFPEPTALALVGLGGLAVFSRRR